MHISLTILGSIARMITCGREKFAWLGGWESLFAQGRQSASHLAYPKTSSPSRCKRQFVMDDLNM